MKYASYLLSLGFKSIPLFWALWIWGWDSENHFRFAHRLCSTLPVGGTNETRHLEDVKGTRSFLLALCLFPVSFWFQSASPAVFSPWLRRFLLVTTGKSSLQLFRILHTLSNVSTISLAASREGPAPGGPPSSDTPALAEQCPLAVWVSSPVGTSSKRFVSIMLNFILCFACPQQ